MLTYVNVDIRDRMHLVGVDGFCSRPFYNEIQRGFSNFVVLSNTQLGQTS